jgi:hypothetical protein
LEKYLADFIQVHRQKAGVYTEKIKIAFKERLKDVTQEAR